MSPNISILWETVIFRKFCRVTAILVGLAFVCINDKGIVCCLFWLWTIILGCISGQRFVYLPVFHPEEPSDCNGSQGIGKLYSPINCVRIRWVSPFFSAFHSSEIRWIPCDAAVDIKIFPASIRNQIQSFGYIHQIGIVMVDKDCRISFLAEEVIQVSPLVLITPSKEPNPSKWGFTDIGYNAIIGSAISQKIWFLPDDWHPFSMTARSCSGFSRSELLALRYGCSGFLGYRECYAFEKERRRLILWLLFFHWFRWYR